MYVCIYIERNLDLREMKPEELVSSDGICEAV